MKAVQTQAMAFAAGSPLTGDAVVPGDKSISHRALMLAALAVGRSRITNLCDGKDIRASAAALRAMGAKIERKTGPKAGNIWEIDGVGVGGLLQPRQPLDMGNSGTAARLLMGLVASHPIEAVFWGDESLCQRPMNRIITPLTRMGARFALGTADILPFSLSGTYPAIPLMHELNIASAQLKSALLLAALNTPGVTRIVEPVPTRDHSERMLKAFGANIHRANGEITLQGEAELQPQHIEVPCDPSAAAFLTVAALIVPGSEVRFKGIGVNPTRTGLYEALQKMGADIEISGKHMMGGEPVADMIVRYSPLRGIEIPSQAVPAMIDEFPIFFIAAAFAEGESRAHGLAELRIKESDRIAAMTAGLNAIGALAKENGDSLIIQGSGSKRLSGGATIHPALDHRIAMSFAVAGLACDKPVTIADMAPVETSFPGFMATLDTLRGL